MRGVGRKAGFSPAVTAVLVEDYMRQLRARGLSDTYHLLTDREKEVLQLLAEGRSNKEVATCSISGSRRSRRIAEHDAEAEPAQHGRDRPLRGAQGDHRLSFAAPAYVPARSPASLRLPGKWPRRRRRRRGSCGSAGRRSVRDAVGLGRLPFASPPVPCISHDSFPEIASISPEVGRDRVVGDVTTIRSSCRS